MLPLLPRSSRLRLRLRRPPLQKSLLPYLRHPAAAPSAPSAGANTVTAPMPGTIVKINVKAGDAVKKGDVFLVLEAMKMENDITSPADCTIASVNVSQGASVSTGDILITYN